MARLVLDLDSDVFLINGRTTSKASNRMAATAMAIGGNTSEDTSSIGGRPLDCSYYRIKGGIPAPSDRNGGGHDFWTFKDTSGGLDCFMGLVSSSALDRSMKAWYSFGLSKLEIVYQWIFR
jgi:hypothetical protein